MKVRSALLLLGAGGGVALAMAFAGPASADNGPHVKNSSLVVDNCASCHRMHSAKASHLLKDPQSQICYSCHGGGGAGATTDVQNGRSYAGGETGLRGGGFEYALIDAANPVYTPGAGATGTTIGVLAAGTATNSNHSVDGSSQMAWGNGAISATVNYGKSVSLSCGSCHDPHGNGLYRILRAIPKESGAVSPGVEIADTATKVYTTANYWVTQDVNASEFQEKIASWCSTCHTRYLADHEAKTDSGDAVYAYRHTSDSTAVSGKARNCANCHTAHGSNASMPGLYSSVVNLPDGTVDTGDSKLLRINNRGTCRVCHASGYTP
ncbi:MAG: cytochrome c3 family protein [Candidatus Nanopelagicales bacterium]|nr:cytochrome c3 family protein [Candidatus Nanopelagicales bacterium]MDZ4250128.1 cytochrome c3 family protein [Candidatus Nanopelagicales bacterium]